MSLLRGEHLFLNYGPTNVIADLSFSIEPGESLCIVGENGCGKTTLLKAVAGLIVPRQGAVHFENGLSRKDIGYLPQQTRIQKDFPASVLEVAISGFEGRCGWRPFYRSGERFQAMRNLKRFGMDAFHSHCYGELSGGQQQRVLLARALCAARRLLLLDEPTTGLDPGSAEKMYRAIGELKQRKGIAVMMVSHDVGTAERFCDRLLRIEAKKR